MVNFHRRCEQSTEVTIRSPGQLHAAPTFVSHTSEPASKKLRATPLRLDANSIKQKVGRMGYGHYHTQQAQGNRGVCNACLHTCAQVAAPQDVMGVAAAGATGGSSCMRTPLPTPATVSGTSQGCQEDRCGICMQPQLALRR